MRYEIPLAGNFFLVCKVDIKETVPDLKKYVEEYQANQEEALKALAREIVAEGWGDSSIIAAEYRSGERDHVFSLPDSKLALTLAGIKAGLKFRQKCEQ